MQRNKLIYALADASLVVSSDLNKWGGGDGAVAGAQPRVLSGSPQGSPSCARRLPINRIDGLHFSE